MQAESGVIGTLIKHPDYITHSNFLKDVHFYNVESGCIYHVINALYCDGITNIDPFNIASKIDSLPRVKATMGKFNIKDIKGFVDMYELAARDTIEEYISLAKKVTVLAFKRDLVKAADGIIRDCYDKDMSLEKLNASAYGKIDSLTQQFICEEEVATLGKSIGKIWKKIVSKRNNDGTFGLPSAYPAFNQYFTYERGELTVVQARMKRGKSILLMNEAVHKAKAGVPVLIVDTEMPDEQFANRLISHLTCIDNKAIKSGVHQFDNTPLTEEEQKKIQDAIQWIEKAPIIHYYSPVIDLDKLYSVCKMLKHTIGLSFVVYDYLKSNETESSANYNILGAMTDFLKNRIAGELDMAVLAACQLNRHGEVADSDKIDRYLTTAIEWGFKTAEMIQRDGKECGNAYAKIRVNRIGEQMSDDENEYIDFGFDGSKMTIEQVQQHEVENEFA